MKCFDLIVEFPNESFQRMHDSINVRRLLDADAAFKQLMTVDYLHDVGAVGKAIEFSKNAANISKVATELKIPAMQA